jgi:hypothetical protein
MSPLGQLFQQATGVLIQIQCASLVQSRHYHPIKRYLFSPWACSIYNRIALNNNHAVNMRA